jgi:molecular chaperone HtpG
MKEGQQEIYYLTGSSRPRSRTRRTWRRSGQGLRGADPRRPIDEVWADQVSEYDGKPLRSIAKGQVDLDGEQDEEGEGAEREA